MPQLTGTVTIDGKEYEWTSPQLQHLAEVEHLVGPITDLATVNSVKGRVYLAYACLREKHPELTPGKIMGWPASAFSEMWTMIAAAIPIYGGAGGRQVPPVEVAASEEGDAGRQDSPTLSPSASSEPLAGIPSAPGDSA